MKTLILIFIIISTMASAQENISMENVQFIIDSWISAEEGSFYNEEWKAVNENELTGTAWTNENGVMIITEKLSIVKLDSGIFYVADVKHNEKPVYFKLIEAGNNKAVFENKTHDFPQKITYELESPDKLHAYIEGKKKGGWWSQMDQYFIRRR